MSGAAPFGRSALWERQAARYDELGQRAWSEGIVPWRVTTCPWTAHAEARLIAAFERDVRERGWLSDEAPLTIWDAGAGTGRLAFHLLPALEELGARVVMRLTDVAARNVEAWKQQPQLRSLHERGLVDFSVHDALAPALPAGLGAPCVVVAHYLFDSLPHSAWRVTDAGVHEGWVDEAANALRWSWRPAAPPPHLEPWLKTMTPGHTALFPDGAATMLQHLWSATQGRCLVIAMDKGAPPLGLEDPPVAEHETVSAGVNFEALSIRSPWTWRSSPPSERLQLVALTGPGDFARLDTAWRETDVAQLLALVDDVAALLDGRATLRQALELQARALDDPDTLAQLAQPVRDVLPTAEEQDVVALVEAIARAADRHFVFEQRLDVPFELATLAQASGALRLAQALYRLRLAERGADTATLYNLAFVLRGLGALEQAREAVDALLALDDTHARGLALKASLEPPR